MHSIIIRPIIKVAFSLARLHAFEHGQPRLTTIERVPTRANAGTVSKI